jgi:TolA-binding protein
MSDSRRPDERWSPFEYDLLRAGRDDAPSRGARRKTLMALGAGTAGALGSSATASGSAAGPAATTASVAGAASKLAIIATGKWIALAVFATGALAAAVHAGGDWGRVAARAPVENRSGIHLPAAPVERHPMAGAGEGEAPSALDSATRAHETTARETPPPAMPAPARRRPAPVLSGPEADPASPRPAADPTPIPLVETAAAQSAIAAPATTGADDAVGSSRATSSEPVPPIVTFPASGLAEEMASLEAARASLRAGDTGSALKNLDRYARAFPHGLLEPESIVLRIEAQLARGDRKGGIELGRRFLDAFPRSPLAPRVRILLGP